MGTSCTVTGLAVATAYTFRVGVLWATDDPATPYTVFSASSATITTLTLAEQEELDKKKAVRATINSSPPPGVTVA